MGQKVNLPEATRSSTIRLFNGEGCPVEYILDARDETDGVVATPRSFFERGTLGHSLIESRLNDDGMEDFIWEEYFASDIHDMEWMETSKCTQAGLAVEVEDMLVQWDEQMLADPYTDMSLIGTEIELDFYTPKGTHVITTVDAVYEDSDGNPIVVDWKLGTSKSGKDMQLYIYWYGLIEAGIVHSNAYFRGWFHYVTYKDPIGFTAAGVYPGDAFIQDYIDESEVRRRTGAFLPNPEWMSCRYCTHHADCPIKSQDRPATAHYNLQQLTVTFKENT